MKALRQADCSLANGRDEAKATYIAPPAVAARKRMKAPIDCWATQVERIWFRRTIVKHDREQKGPLSDLRITSILAG